jgi:hypothetical protein
MTVIDQYAYHLVHLLSQRVVGAHPGVILDPFVEVVARTSPVRKVRRNQHPLTPCLLPVEQRIENFTKVEFN